MRRARNKIPVCRNGQPTPLNPTLNPYLRTLENFSVSL